MGKSPYMKIDELFLQKIGEATESKQNFAMKRGHDLEIEVRKEIESLYGETFEPLCVSHNQYPWAKASLDGYMEVTNPKDNLVLEIKYVGRENFDLICNDIIPKHHLDQLQWQLFVTGCENLIYVATNGKKDDKGIVFHSVEVKADKEHQATLLKTALWFHNCVVTRVPPSEPISDDIIAHLKYYEDVTLQIKALQEIADAEKEILKSITPKDKSLAWGRVTASWIERKGAIEYAKIPDLIGINLEMYRKPPVQYFELRLK